MKQSDIITVILIAAVGVVVSAVACNALLGNPDEEKVTFTTVQAISGDLAQPDAEVFNTSALNPTVEVFVGNCEDVDQNGTIDSAELLACGQAAPEVEGDDGEDATNEKNTSTNSRSSMTVSRSVDDVDDEEDEETDEEDDE